MVLFERGSRGQGESFLKRDFSFNNENSGTFQKKLGQTLDRNDPDFAVEKVTLIIQFHNVHIWHGK